MMPANPKIYHIVHIDRLASIIQAGSLWCDAIIAGQNPAGTMIGMNSIKERRLHELTLDSYPNLHVGECVPFYFCPRSIMLYLIHMQNPELAYKGGQQPIIHLVADLYTVVNWANQNNRRWAFTLSNAGSYYFEDRNNLANLDDINWDAVNAQNWASCKDGKQAEFLLEQQFPWQLIEQIGVMNPDMHKQVGQILYNQAHQPNITTQRGWYY